MARPLQLLIAFLAFVGLCAPARAAEPPLAVYVGQTAGDVRHGDTLIVTLSIYSTSTSPLEVALTAPPPAGLRLQATTWSTSTIQLARPVTVALRYQVDAPNDGRYYSLSYTARAGPDVARAETAVRVGTITWPAATPPRLWLPMVRK